MYEGGTDAMSLESMEQVIVPYAPKSQSGRDYLCLRRPSGGACGGLLASLEGPPEGYMPLSLDECLGVDKATICILSLILHRKNEWGGGARKR